MKTAPAEIVVRESVMRVGVPLALAYTVMIGGTQWGEFTGLLRVVNALLAGAFVIVFVSSVGRRSDRVDLFVVLALLAFLAACLASAFPRQSLDAALAALCWVAVFYVARDVFSDVRLTATVIATMVALSVVTTLVLAVAEFGQVVRWLSLTNGEVSPPLGLPVDGRPWGDDYDMAMLAVMLYPAWFVGRMSRGRIVGAALVGAVLGVAVVLLGARNLWLATALATILVGVPPLVRYLARVTPRGRIAVIGALCAGLVLLVAVGAPFGERLFAGATLEQRTAMWSAATEAWIDRPVAGYGPGAYPWILETTDFFSTNSGHQRHPHNVVFQLLPEAGILGIAAAGLLILGVGIPLLRARRGVALWPIAVFLLGGIGSNPTVYPFLIVVAITWAAFALPRDRTPPSDPSRGQVTVRRLGYAGVALIGVAMLPLLAGGVIYDTAVVAARRGDTSTARDALRIATGLDPGMALYARQLGVAEILEGDAHRAIGELRRATELNPMDSVAWRALAIARASEMQDVEARQALDEALALDRSDPSNLLLLAEWQAEAGDLVGLRSTSAEIALAWPTVVFAPGWRELLGEVVTPEEVVPLALERWSDGAPSPEPLVGQPLLLSILADDPDLDAASRLSGLSESLVRASVEVLRCGDSAAELLAATSTADRRTEVFWALRNQHASERGQSDTTALDLYEIRTRSRPSIDRAYGYLHPLRQNNTDGALDPFGYGRLPIAWPIGDIRLPDPDAGLSRWLVDMRGARTALYPNGGPGSCEAPSSSR